MKIFIEFSEERERSSKKIVKQMIWKEQGITEKIQISK